MPPAALTKDIGPSSRSKKPNLTIKPPKFRRSNSLGPTYDSPESSPFCTAKEYPSSSSSFRRGMHRNASVPIPGANFSPPDSEVEDYGEVITTELDAVALNSLQPRLQASMRALKAERDDRRAITDRSPSEPLLSIQKQTVIEPVSEARSVSEGREAGSKRKRGAPSHDCGEAEEKKAEIKKQHVELKQTSSAAEAREADLARKRMPLCSNPLTEIERAQARTLTKRCRSTTSRHTWQEQLLTIKPAVHNPKFREMSSILPQLPPGPVDRRPIVKKKSHASIRTPKPRLSKISRRIGTARNWIKKMFRKDKDYGRDIEGEWEEDAEDAEDDEDDGNDDELDGKVDHDGDEDKNVYEEGFDETHRSEGVDLKENRLHDCRCQNDALRRFIPLVYSPAKTLPMKPLPSEPPLRPPPARPQAPGQPTSRAAMEGYF